MSTDDNAVEKFKAKNTNLKEKKSSEISSTTRTRFVSDVDSVETASSMAKRERRNASQGRRKLKEEDGEEDTSNANTHNSTAFSTLYLHFRAILTRPGRSGPP
ncbi:hypothetical protein RUM43_006857 [Polyplax serrata]|uniref:Uncharacterized protein n=1 Tax=Polyplax serrata TaxID=468196 RepID=A0AAN8P4Q5_POLSC